MSKIPVLFAAETIACGRVRAGGAIYNLPADDAHALIRDGKGRQATAEEMARLGVSDEPKDVPGALKTVAHELTEDEKKREAAIAARRAKKPKADVAKAAV